MSRQATVQALKNKLTELYREHNPEKVKDIEYLLKKYENNENLLYNSVCQKYEIPADPLTRKVKEWDAATGKNNCQIICNTTGEVLETIDEDGDAEEDEYDPFSENPSQDKDKITEQVIKDIDCALLGEKESNMFSIPKDDAPMEEETKLKKVTAVDSMGEL
ncbi:unnamed protein product [Amoebophrya sp. A120]|nr:unnamed protein product [Amoebophrya sp. A120]|eukprot:GSA120T00004852001.1